MQQHSCQVRRLTDYTCVTADGMIFNPESKACVATSFDVQDIQGSELTQKALLGMSYAS